MTSAYVYVVQDATGLFKVGYSTNATRRVKSLVVEVLPSRRPLKIVAVKKMGKYNALAVEKITHALLARYLVPVVSISEWFSAPRSLVFRRLNEATRMVRIYKRRNKYAKFSWKDVWFAKQDAK